MDLSNVRSVHLLWPRNNVHQSFPCTLPINMPRLPIAGAPGWFEKITKISERPVIDNVIYRMHYRTTAGFLFLACAVSTAHNIMGANILCFTTDSNVSQPFLNSFCWVGNSFTLPDIKGGPGHQNPYPGIGPDSGHTRKYHSFYIWVPLVLCLQGFCFLYPRWLWMHHENGLMEALTDGLSGLCVTRDPTKKVKLLVEYLNNFLNSHNNYAFGYYWSEFLNLCNSP